MYGYDTSCSSPFLITIGIYLLIDLVLIITTIIVFHNFIQTQTTSLQETNDKEPLAKSLYYSGLVFIIITCLSLLFQISVLKECYVDLDGNLMFTTLWLCGFIAYWVQYYSLIIHLYIRLEVIFNDTIFRVSMCTRYTFICIFILSLITCPISPLPWMIHKTIFYASGTILFGCLSLLLLIIFIYKLIQIYRKAEGCIVNEELQLQSQPDNPEVIDKVIERVSTHRLSPDNLEMTASRLDERNDNILASITKTFILGLISIICSILGAIYVVIYSSEELRDDIMDWFGIDENSKIMITIFYLVYLIDIYTNFSCMMLAFKQNESKYKCICGCCDKFCQCCCKYFVLISVKRSTLKMVNSKEYPYSSTVNRFNTDALGGLDDDIDSEEPEEEPLVVL